MKARETMLRLKRRDVEEKTRKVEELERIIREFETMAADLDRQIQLEEDRSGIRDSAHFSYPTYAKAAATRRDNLRNSTVGLREQLSAAIRERDDTAENLARSSAQADNRKDVRPATRRSDRLFGGMAR